MPLPSNYRCLRFFNSPNFVWNVCIIGKKQPSRYRTPPRKGKSNSLWHVLPLCVRRCWHCWVAWIKSLKKEKKMQTGRPRSLRLWRLWAEWNPLLPSSLIWCVGNLVFCIFSKLLHSCMHTFVGGNLLRFSASLPSDFETACSEGFARESGSVCKLRGCNGRQSGPTDQTDWTPTIPANWGRSLCLVPNKFLGEHEHDHAKHSSLVYRISMSHP